MIDVKWYTLCIEYVCGAAQQREQKWKLFDWFFIRFYFLKHFQWPTICMPVKLIAVKIFRSNENKKESWNNNENTKFKRFAPWSYTIPPSISYYRSGVEASRLIWAANPFQTDFFKQQTANLSLNSYTPRWIVFEIKQTVQLRKSSVAFRCVTDHLHHCSLIDSPEIWTDHNKQTPPKNKWLISDQRICIKIE